MKERPWSVSPSGGKQSQLLRPAHTPPLDQSERAVVRSEGAFGSVSGAFGGRGGAALRQAESAELRAEELLQAVTGLRLVSVTRVVLKTVGEHELHVGDELTWRQRQETHHHHHQVSVL